MEASLTTPSPPQTSTAELTPAIQAELRAASLADLYVFTKGVLGFDKFTPHIHQPLCRLLELYNGHDASLAHPWRTYREVLKDAYRRRGLPREKWDARLEKARRRGLKRLAILLPRTWLKTTLVSIAYPLWRAVRDSNVRVCVAQNTFTNARAKGSAIAQLVDGCQLFRLLFPEVLPGPKQRWCDEARCLQRPGSFAESTFEFAGAGTQVTSRHYNVIIEDDTVAPSKDDLGEDAILPSPTDVAQAIGWHRLVPPLLVDMQDDQNVVVGTRWFELDLLKWVMDNEEQFTVYQRGAREDEHGRPSAQGAVTYPERFNDEVLEELQASMGPYLYSCLYLNMPVRVGEMTFKPEWLKEYAVEPRGLTTYTTVDGGDDPAESKGRPDYTVVLTCGKDLSSGKVYVLAYDRERCPPGRTIELIFEHVRRWHPVCVGLQPTHHERMLKAWLRERMVQEGTFFLVRSLRAPKKGKPHIRGLQPFFAAEALLLRPHMDALKNELLVYPLGKNDDVADALGMQLELWQITPSAQEQAVESLKGPCDFDYVLELARAESERQEQMRSGRAQRGVREGSRAAWGPSVSNLAFHGPGGVRRAIRWA